MPHLKQSTGDYEWLAYYERFNYFAPEKVREGCYPRIMEHPTPTQKAIVLVHGLSDSPYFMTAIGNFFYQRLKYNVYIPLLHFHGLKEPNGMEGVELEEWKANVCFAIDSAASKSEQISIGGFSTGAALSFYCAVTNPKINNALYLFSAALDLKLDRTGLLGDLVERLLRTFLGDIVDSNKPLIGKNPYRYSRIDIDGVRELARLIKETDTLINGFSRKKPFPKKTFAAHSECDTIANITGVEELERVSSHFAFYRIPKSLGVPHTSLILKDPIPNVGEPLETSNPEFENMMGAIDKFVREAN